MAESRAIITDEWARWQQGGCLDYAIALVRHKPTLQFGTIYDMDGLAAHHFAHDDMYAYDSAGRHPLPYLGVAGTFPECVVGEDPTWYDPPDEDEVLAATRHIVRHKITEEN